MKENLKELILLLISSKREGEYWDFKEQFHKNNASLLHDIICMANNRVDRDAYIIFGITDKECEIVGIENDSNRKNQQQIIDVLKSKKFAGGIRPIIELHTLKSYKHEIDVLIVKNTNDTPYYLVEDYREQNKLVKSQYIYTRVGDTNTDIDKGADINHIEYLWKKRFLLNKPPLEQIKNKLNKKEEWIREDDSYYNIFNAEYKIDIIYDEEDLNPEFYSYSMYNQSTSYGILEIKSYTTKLYAHQFVVLDSGRYVTTTPSWEYISFGEYKMDIDYCFKYFIKDDINYKLHKFLLDEESDEALHAYRNFCEVILIFENEVEKEIFMKYLYNNKEQLERYIKENSTSYEWVWCNNELERKENIKRLKTGKALNIMLKEFKNL